MFVSCQMTTAIAIEDVRREVKILKALTGHHNLVRFYDACEDNLNVYIVMEYVLFFQYLGSCLLGVIYDFLVERTSDKYFSILSSSAMYQGFMQFLQPLPIRTRSLCMHFVPAHDTCTFYNSSEGPCCN